MSDTELITIVEQMRNAQRSYFRERSIEALNTSKDLERQVDVLLRERKDRQRMLPLENTK